MMPAMYAAISGLEAHQTMLDVTANNLANIDTIGYKAQRTTFESELSELLSGGSGQTASNGGTNPMQVGLGVQVGSIDNIMTAGSLQSTGNTLDVAIQGEGFLCVGSGTPGATPTDGVPATSTLQYTRAGNLTTDSVGYLTTASGQYVLGSTTAGGQPNTYLQIPPGSTNVAIGQDGSVTYTDENTADTTYGQTVTAGYVSLATFPNDAGLTRDAGSNWSTSSNSGAATYGTPNTGTFQNSQLISGELEQSNVDMANEFTNMIEAERGYQANSSVISTADQMMQTLVQMAQGG
jgi:flagellar hook protein FlgE